MPWKIVLDPSQETLDMLYKEATDRATQPCHDCGAVPSEIHKQGCDVARCSICGGQLLSCGCSDGQPDIWDGMWPGTKECYEKKYVARWEGNAPLPDWGKLTFDYNRLAENAG